MAPAFNESRWHQLTEEITMGMRDRRAQHPKATLWGYPQLGTEQYYHGGDYQAHLDV